MSHSSTDNTLFPNRDCSASSTSARSSIREAEVRGVEGGRRVGKGGRGGGEGGRRGGEGREGGRKGGGEGREGGRRGGEGGRKEGRKGGKEGGREKRKKIEELLKGEGVRGSASDLPTPSVGESWKRRSIFVRQLSA